MKLYYSKGACSLAVRIVIKEIDVPCEFEAVNLKTKQTATGVDFLTINPKGAVPTLVLDNGEILTENTVIQLYLADTYKANHLLSAMPDFQRYQTLAWSNYVSTELHKGCGPLFNPNVPPEVKDAVFKPALKSKLQFINKHLHQHKYLAGDHFTLPDAYLFVILRWMHALGIDLSECKHVNDYFTEIKKHPAVAKALQEEGL